MTYACPKGHDSSDADYCSECGARIGAAPTGSAPAVTPSPVPDECPDCATLRTPGSRFCEVCRYDFASKTSGSVSPLLPEPTRVPPMPPVTPPAALAVPTPFQRLQVRIAADPTLVKESDPAHPFPDGTPDRVFHLDLADNLVGRFSESKDSHPEIPVKDPGVSRRHLKLVRQADGQFAALELGSSNGTVLNGDALDPGVAQPLKPGDVLLLGMWTRLTIEAR